MNIPLSIVVGLKLKEMSQTELAKKTGLTKQWVNKIVKGHAKPSLDVLADIANAFDVPVSRFIEWGEKQ